ncbi:MAG: hypothetical protein K2G67_00745 [Muribaculaceae bacterium]|nr:hypothetical protein [Muribaculaceae bacterium]
MKRGDAIILVTLLLLMIVGSCGGDPRKSEGMTAEVMPAPWDLVEEGEDPLPTAPVAPWPGEESAEVYIAGEETADSTMILPEADEGDANYAPDSVQSYDRTRYRGLGRLAEVFNDSNKYQYAAGERIGIRPISSLAEAYYLRRPLVKIESCDVYHVEELTHSVPYLVPEAASLLETIGRNFRDSLSKRGITGHTMRVTSVLRTAQSVKRLRRVNRNATDSSTHKLGTTFDISYARFDHDGQSPRHSDEELKYVLAEVLRDLRSQRKCLVKFERKSPCFHITATGK